VFCPQPAPFVDETGDVASFQEVRTTASVDIEEAVWILTTNQAGKPAIPHIDELRAKYGRISQSFWHRSHQMGILGEWQFTRLMKDDCDVPVSFTSIGFKRIQQNLRWILGQAPIALGKAWKWRNQK